MQAIIEKVKVTRPYSSASPGCIDVQDTSRGCQVGSVAHIIGNAGRITWPPDDCAFGAICVGIKRTSRFPEITDRGDRPNRKGDLRVRKKKPQPVAFYEELGKLQARLRGGRGLFPSRARRLFGDLGPRLASRV